MKIGIKGLGPHASATTGAGGGCHQQKPATGLWGGVFVGWALLAILFGGCGMEEEKPQPSKTANAGAAQEQLSGEVGYGADVRAILSQHCSGCHGEYNSYQGAAAGIGGIISTIESGSMPPAGYGEVPQEQLNILAWWRDLGTPQ